MLIMPSIFNFKLDLNDPTTFWAGTANAFFVGLAIFGTDQELVQRLLTVQTRKKSQQAIISTIFASLPMLCIYLSIGTLLYVFYANQPSLAPAEAKGVLSHFAVHELPAGFKGLILAAVILASIDSPLASLSSSFVMDIYKPLINSTGSGRHYLFISRAGVVGFGIVLAFIAFACKPIQSVLWFAFQVLAVTGPALLGVFLYGIFSPKVSFNGRMLAVLGILIMVPIGVYGAATWVVWVVAGSLIIVLQGLRVISSRYPAMSNTMAMVLTSSLMLAILLLGKAEYLKLAWSWLIVIGTFMTFLTAYLLDSKKPL